MPDLNIGHRRVGLLMAETGIGVERWRSYKVTTDSIPAFHIAPNLLERRFAALDIRPPTAQSLSQKIP